MPFFKTFIYCDNYLITYKKNMSEEVYDIAKENDLTFDEAMEIQELVDERGMEAGEAFEAWEER